MTILERKFEKIVVQLRKRYPFIADVEIDVNEGYGISGATGYRSGSNSIAVDLKSLKKNYGTKRFDRRFGKCDTFDEFTLLVLLHEIHHVKQFQTIAPHRLTDALIQIDPFDKQSHDESWIEKEADKWARQQIKKVRSLSR